MEQLINDIYTGKLEGLDLALEFSCGNIEDTVYLGDVYQGSFHIYTVVNVPAKCYVYSSDARVILEQTEYKGVDIEVRFTFDTNIAENGDTISGHFDIVSQCGEYSIPYSISVANKPITSSIGVIKNTFHFANLARNNFNEALALFYSERFKEIFIGSDYAYLDLYRALSAYPGNPGNMDEFLCSINKKKRVEYSFEYEHYSMDVYPEDEGLIETTVAIKKEEWGYVSLDVECDGDFVYPERTHITEDDFVGNKFDLILYVDPQRVMIGENRATLSIKSNYSKKDTVIKVNCVDKNYSRSEAKKERLVVSLVDNFVLWKLNKINFQAWVKTADSIVEELVSYDSDSLYNKLFSAHILILKERTNEAQWSLEYTQELYERSGINDSVFRAYYNYLSSILKNDDHYRLNAIAEIKDDFKRDNTNWKLGWFLLFPDFNKEATPSMQWDFIKKMYQKGCTSPLYYGAAVNYLNSEPILLKGIDEFTRQVIAYGAKKDALNKEVIERLTGIVSRLRDYDQLLITSIKRIYRKTQNKDLLAAVCEMAVRGQLTDKNMFTWYELAIKEQIKLPNLYEYYMLSIDKSTQLDIPKEVIIYFSFKHNLPVNVSAYLYSYVCSHKDELEDVYPNYAANINSFLYQMLSTPVNDANLIRLYREVLDSRFINKDNINVISKLIFMSRIKVNDPSFINVIIYYENIVSPEIYPIRNGEAYCPIYGTEKCICFENALGQRFVKQVNVEIEKLLPSGKYLNLFENMKVDNICFNIDIRGFDDVLSDFEAVTALSLCRNKQVVPSYRNDLFIKLANYFYSNEYFDELDELCDSWVAEHKLTRRLKAEILKFYVHRERLDIILEFIDRFSFYYADEKLLVKVVMLYVEKYGMQYDYNIFKICEHVFASGKHNTDVISFLVNYAGGSIKLLYGLFMAAVKREVPCRKLAEGILLQSLFSKAYYSGSGEVFGYYLNNEPENKLVHAFLKQSCYEYFVNESITDKIIFEETERFSLLGEEADNITKLALLKAYADNEIEMSEESIEVARKYLTDVMQSGIVLKFFNKIKGCDDLILRLHDKVIIEYRTSPGRRVRIHYCIEKNAGEEGNYTAVYMNEVGGGIFFLDIILFFGEELQYYIMEEKEGMETLTESGSVRRPDAFDHSSETMFSMINDLIICDTLKDYDTFEAIMVDYVNKEALSRSMFKLV